MPLYLGCPIWGLKGWVGNFFPAGAKQRDFLALYSRRLNTVEGNTTFYAIPDPATRVTAQPRVRATALPLRFSAVPDARRWAGYSTT